MAWRYKTVPTEPTNFSWVIEDEVCALGLPKKDSDLVFLLDNNVRCLVSLTNKRVPSIGKFPDIKLKKFRVPDFTAPSLKQIDKILKTIGKFNRKGKAVAIQCLHGTGRTGTVLACLFVKRFKYQPGVAINKIQTMRPGSFESKQQEDRVHEFWEREQGSDWLIEIEVCNDSDSSEDEAWFIEEEIGDWIDVYDDSDDVIEVVHDDVRVYDSHGDVDLVVEDDDTDDDVILYDNHHTVVEDDGDIIEDINETLVESSDSD